MQGAIIFDHYYSLTARDNGGKLYNTLALLIDMRTILEVKNGVADVTMFPYSVDAQYMLQTTSGLILMFDTNVNRIFTLSLSNNNDEESDGSFTDWETKFRSKSFVGKSLFILKQPRLIRVNGDFSTDLTVIPYYFSDRRGADAQAVVGRNLFIMGTNVMGDNISELPSFQEAVIPSGIVTGKQ